MNDINDSSCQCTNCVGDACTCGCQAAANACACAPACECGDTCRCGANCSCQPAVEG